MNQPHQLHAAIDQARLLETALRLIEVKSWTCQAGADPR